MNGMKTIYGNLFVSIAFIAVVCISCSEDKQQENTIEEAAEAYGGSSAQSGTGAMGGASGTNDLAATGGTAAGASGTAAQGGSATGGASAIPTGGVGGAQAGTGGVETGTGGTIAGTGGTTAGTGGTEIEMDGGVDAQTGDAQTGDAQTGDAQTGDSTVPVEGGAIDTNDTYPEPATVADYTQPGPYTVVRELNQGLGTVSGGSNAFLPSGNNNDPSGFTLFYPEGGQPGEIYPILTFGNGTACSPTFYDEFIGHVVSYGYIVIAPNTSNTGSAVEMLQGVEWVIEQNGQSSSPLYGKVDTETVGAMGHSQGGAGTCRAGADQRVDAIATLSGTSSVDQIQCPAFFLTSGSEAGSSPDDRINSTLSAVTQPSMYGVSVGGSHDEYADIADQGMLESSLPSNDGLYSRGPVAAWFDWQLKGWDSVGELFLQDPCAFCNANNLQRLDTAGF